MPEGSPRPMTPVDWKLRAELYRQFIQGAGPPSHAALGAAVGMEEAEILERLAVLAEHHLITLKGDAGFIWMVHPFSAVPTAFPVETLLGLFWANCAWDVLGVPALLGVDSTMRTRCAESGYVLELGVLGGDLWGEGCVHFLVPPRDSWNDIGYT